MQLSHPEKFNIALAEKVLDHVTRFPEQHDQGTFFRPQSPHCGTAGCIAGWACFLNGEFLNGEDLRNIRSAHAVPLLGLNVVEFAQFYTEMDEEEAKRILADYIAQAHAAQDPPPALPVAPMTEPEPVGSQDKELVHA